jgi:hypothetical protein
VINFSDVVVKSRGRERWREVEKGRDLKRKGCDR